MDILAIIPARSGSKSLPHKNIRKINGKPMLAYSIDHAKKSNYITRIIVSTDSEEYAGIAREYGAEVPFLRPEEYARDDSLDFDVFYHVLSTLAERENYRPDIVVHLRPTYPIRNSADIDAMIELMLQDEEIDSVRTIAPAKEIPYKMWHKDEGGKLRPLLTDIPGCYNMPRQELPQIYFQNACIDLLRPRVVLEQNSMSGTNIMGYEMSYNYDIDTEEEFRKAEGLLKLRAGGKRFVFDIDGVIAKLQEKNNYDLSEPNVDMIKIVNRLYDYGNYIVLFTARGYVTGIDWSERTKAQMKDWNVKYHELLFGKPNADYYIDDKLLDPAVLLDMEWGEYEG